MKCENCGKEHDGSYGSGRFCSESCKQQYNLKPKENKHYCCKFCGKEFGKPTSLAAHVSTCKLNPNSSRTKAKAAQTYSKNARKQNPLITITTKCCNCGKAFQQTITTKEYERNAYHKCCSSYCSHAYAANCGMTLENKNKRKELIQRMLKAGTLFGGNCVKRHHNRKTHYCQICGKQIEQYKSKLYCSKECAIVGKHNKLSTAAKARCAKGEFGGKNNDTYKKYKHGWYKGFYCGSSWELAFLIWALDHKLNIKRCDKIFKYEYHRKVYNYYPDFEIDGEIYEIKGFEDHKAKVKHNAFPEIKYLRKADLKEQFKYVEETYGKNYVELLEASK